MPLLHTAVRFGLIRQQAGTVRHQIAAAQSCVAPLQQQQQQQLRHRQHSHHQASSSQTLLETPASVYVHLPFCKRRCFYCDFPVSVIGSKPEQPGIQQGMQEYVDLLCQEIQATIQLPGPPLQTVFFGGGTPTLVPPAMLEQILQAIEQRYSISPTAEISMESDPGTFDTYRLQQYMSLGVNRFSMGVQCFQQNLLELCGRSHTLSDVYKAIDSMHSAGIANWSLDLISGLPQLTSNDWQHSLQEAVAASPAHISVYDLQVEAKTPFARWYQPGSHPLPDDAASADMYRMASIHLQQAGYEHYEISNYAKPGFRSQHNFGYWQNAPFYAFGVGAASYLFQRRFSRPKTIKAYTAWVQQFMKQAQHAHLPGRVPGWTSLEAEGFEDKLLDYVMLRLRLADGIPVDTLRDRFGSTVVHAVEKALEVGSSPYAYRTEINGRAHLRLSDPEGFLISNECISTVFAHLMSESGTKAEHSAVL